MCASYLKWLSSKLMTENHISLPQSLVRHQLLGESSLRAPEAILIVVKIELRRKWRTASPSITTCPETQNGTGGTT